MRGAGGQLHHTYGSAIKGFAATLPDAALQGLRNNPNVNYVEQDQTVSLNQVASPQQQATWGLDRIDQADRPLDSQYSYTQTGAGVYVAVLDTGLAPNWKDYFPAARVAAHLGKGFVQSVSAKITLSLKSPPNGRPVVIPAWTTPGTERSRSRKRV